MTHESMNRGRPQALKLALVLAALIALPACDSAEKQKAAAAAAAAEQGAAKESKAQEIGKQFDAQFAQHNWELARAHGEELVVMHPDSPVTARIRAQYEEAKAKSLAARDKMRLALLWDYQTVQVKSGKDQLSAALYSKESVDTGGDAKHPVRLIFRDHPEWGRSSYLVLEAGDFDCYSGCRLKVVADGKTHALPGSRPKTEEAIAMFIEDEAALWKHAQNARQIAIEFPIKAGGTRTAIFVTGGLDPSKLPKW